MEYNRLDFEKKYGRLLTEKEGQLENYRNLIAPNRTDLLNCLVEKYELKRYLEIGVQDPKQNFDKIKCMQKVSVDPDPNARATFQITSDEYFKDLHWVDNQMGVRIILGFDLIFIDGLHTAEQVKKDFENALKILSPNGFIVLHDCNPEKEEHTIVPRPTPTGHWNGDVYKFAATIGRAKHTIAIDNGCMVIYGDNIYVPKQQRYFYLDGQPDWQTFSANRIGLLNLISWDEFVSL